VISAKDEGHRVHKKDTALLCGLWMSRQMIGSQ
jgi:hypothetical protein